MDQFRIFIIEDEPWYADFLKYHLTMNPDFVVEKYSTGKECLSNLYKKPSLVTVDFTLPDMNGKELLEKIRKNSPETAVIMISGQEDITTAVELLKTGAFDYIVKNENTPGRLRNSIRLLQENISLKQENEKLKELVGRKYDFSKIILGNSPGMQATFALMEKAASSQITVSITGETGTGKELVAKSIHYHSDRRNYPFIAVNVSAIPRDLIESELFGYEKGAFTGANYRKTGVFEAADRGTIFLDEVAEMDLNMQTKLLRVLQEREITRLGSTEPVKVDVRIITATHKNLSEEVKKGNFRSDLFYRLMGLPIHLVALRERGNDIIKLARLFADSFSAENNRKKAELAEDAVTKLLSYSYPGNVRELKAIMELAVILCDGSRIEARHLSFNPAAGPGSSITEEMTLENHTARIVSDYLARYNRNPTEVARRLGISRATVYRYIKNFNL